MEDNKVAFMTKDEFEAMNRTLNALADGNAKVAKLTKREFEKQKVIDAFHMAFDMLGGVPRLVYWANENYTEFIKLYAKQLPSGAQLDVNASGEIQFKMVLPPSPLDALEDKSNGGHIDKG